MHLSFKAFLVAFCLAMIMLSCNRSGKQSGAASQSQSTNTKRYHLKGKVVSIDKRANMANIDGEEIPGFMGAMTMPYVVKPASELDKLAAGDVVTADVVVQGDDSWLENVVVTGHSASPAK
jgi:protein SCO1